MNKKDQEYFDSLDSMTLEEYSTFYELLQKFSCTPIFRELESDAWGWYEEAGRPIEFPDPSSFVCIRERMRKDKEKQIKKEKKAKEKERAAKKAEKEKKDREREALIQELVDNSLSVEDAKKAVEILRRKNESLCGN
ncbi:MAG: hypothetical protein WC476_01595 [Phycisphaerae bacterium]|jgi:hypothetical protein